MGMSSGGGDDDLKSEINVTPLVDVMLVLLIIFMITAPMMNTGVDIELPQASAKSIENPEQKVILSIGPNKALQLQNTKITWRELEAKLKANELLKRENELFVEADGRLPYGVIIAAMAIAKNAGVGKVMMLTDPGENMTVEELDKTVAP
jgi:biopolymer transport protein TolR